MAFRIKHGERVDDAVRRIVQEQLEAAEREANDADLPLDERVHAIRSRIKKARAALRLLSPSGDRGLASEERALRDLSRSLARARDAAVTRATLHRLSHDGDAGARVPDAERTQQDQDEQDLGRALERLASLRRRAFRVPHGGRVARGAFARGYREARRLQRELRPDESGARFHEWRKVVKRLSLQLRILRQAAPRLGRALDGPLEHLPDLLGEIHDLSILHARLEDSNGAAVPVEGHDLQPVLSRLRAESAAKRKEALRLGARAFAPKPREVRARLDAGWRAWRA